MTFHYPLILDSLIAILLVATIVYAALLNKRLSALRDNRAELEKAARSFAEAASRADAGIKALKLAADKTGATLHKDIDRAQGLRDELTFLVEAGEALATRLESASRMASKSLRMTGEGTGERAEQPILRAVAGTSFTGPRPERAKGAGEHGPDRELLKAIENMR